MTFKTRLALLLIVLTLLAGLLGVYLIRRNHPPQSFDSSRAYQDLAYQVNLGPRIPGSAAHLQTANWIVSQLSQAGWDARVIEGQVNGLTARNILAKRGSGPVVMLGVHYDSRRFADQDPDPTLRSNPVPGANDGASGVAVLLELARSLPIDLPQETWLVFFDLEDQGGIEGREFIEGSTAFAAQMTTRPSKVIILDMIGDANLNIYFEGNSSRTDSDSLWSTAASLGYAQTFIPKNKYNMIDDHTPFLKLGIPSVNMIDFDYPYWHTTSDNLSHVSAKSLDRVGNTLWTWLQK